MLTATEIYKEYARCLTSPIYAVETYFETFDKTREGFVPFKLFPRQKEIISAYEKNRFNLVTKPRQAGVSTTTAAYMSIKVGFADSENPEAVLIIANKQELAFEFLAKIKDFLSQLPRWVWGPEYYGSVKNEEKTIFLTDSKKEIKLPNGSRVKAVATSKDALRGFTPTYLVMDEAAYIDNGAEVFGAALTALGCLTKDSLILTENGLVELDELVQEKEKLGFTDLEIPHRVCNKDGKIVDATQTFVSEYGQTFKIKTKLGIELEGSWKHPILIDRGGVETWVRMNELVIGDRPIIQYGQNYFGNNSEFIFNFDKHQNNKNITIPKKLEENLDFCYLLGLFVAEGNFTSRGINITNVDEYITNFLITDKAGLGSSFKKVDDRHYQFHSTELIEWLKSFGLDKHNARDKEIPLSLLKMPKNVIKVFLQGMFDGDGMSTVKEIKYSSTSKKLIKTLQTLLLNFGIISHIKYEERKTSNSSVISNKNHTCKIYNLRIYSNNAIKFYNEIGFRLDRKQKNKEHLINKKLNSRFVDVDQEVILNILQKNGLSKSKFRFLERFWVSKYKRLSYESLNRLMVEIPNDEKLTTLYEQIKNKDNYYIDEIIEITKDEGYTYDLHVPETNSFISNGIISHNTGGKATLISTPNGLDELYYKTYDQAKTRKNNFNIIEMKWYEDLRYNKDLRWVKDGVEQKEYEFTFESYEKRIDEGWKPTSSWYEEMCRGMNNDPRMIAQELDVSFIGSGGNVISDEFITFHNKNNVMDPKKIIGYENEVWIWEEPIVGHQYILASDVSRGDGEDYSTFTIIDFTTMEQVVEYQGKIAPDLLAQLIEQYGNMYNAYVIVDVTGGMGVSTVLKLLEFNYKKLHYDDVNGKVLSSKQRELSNFNENNKTPGFHATSVRLPMISNLEQCIRENTIKIRSSRIISEMKTFVYRNGRPDHMKGSHDDCLMSLAMGLWVLQHSFKKLEKLEKQNIAMLNSWVGGAAKNPQEVEMEKGSGFVSNSNRNVAAMPKPRFNHVVSKNMQDPTGQYLWLFSGSK
jgi:intein/homing endonuclease